MKRGSLQSLVALATVFGGVTISAEQLLAQQIIYPSPDSAKAVMVTGKGVASAPADTAELYFIFSSQAAPEPYPTADASGPPKKPQAITQAALKPVVDAIAALGIPPSAIELNVNRGRPRYGSYGSSEASVIVKLEAPTRSRLRQVVDTAVESAAKIPLYIPNTSVEYGVKDCASLEKAAYTAAVKDAQRRSQAIATAMNASLVETPSIAEAFYGAFYPSCTSEDLNPFDSRSYRPSLPYNADAEPLVKVRKDIFATYKIK